MDPVTTELDESNDSAAAEAAFIAGFDDNDATGAAHVPEEHRDAADPPKDPQAPATNDAALTASSDGDVDVALASLPEPYRVALGRVPALESKLATAEGRLRAQADELKELRKLRTQSSAADGDPVAASKPSPRDAAIGKVREVLPEVADAIEAAMPAPAPAPAPVAAAPAPQLSGAEGVKARFPELTQVHPDWVDVVNEPAWDAWLARQPYEKQVELQGTASQVAMTDAVTRFKAHRGSVATPAAAPAAPARAPLGDQRQARLAAAAVPEGASARPASVTTSPEDEAMAAFIAGFNDPGM